MRSFLLLFLWLPFVGFAQETTEVFPDDFFGNYKGILLINNNTGMSEYPMEFHLQPTDTIGKYVYTLIYGEGEQRQVRNYNLIEKDANKGTFTIDENNGILLDTKVVGNRLYTLFEVDGNLLTTFITFGKEQMLFEIVFANTQNKTTSGGSSEDIPEVYSYPITVVQRATLLKQ